MSTSTALASFLAPLALKDWLGPVATATAALIAITGVIISTVIQRRTGRESIKQAQRSADAAHVSATASERSSKAAVEAVGVNRETATGVAQRAEADALAKRYQDSATQMGHASAAVRLAGLYAMARLADDWEDQRQTCVNVLCAYYRTKKEADDEEWHVKRSLLELLAERYRPLKNELAGKWSECSLDLNGSVFRDANFSQMCFLAPADLSRSRYEGVTFFSGTRIGDTLSLGLSTVSGPFYVQGEVLSDGTIEAQFLSVDAGVEVGIRCRSVGEGAEIQLDGTEVRGVLEIVMRNQPETAGMISASHLKVADGGRVQIRAVGITGEHAHMPEVVANAWMIGAGVVSYDQTLLRAGLLEFDHHEITSPEAVITARG